MNKFLVSESSKSHDEPRITCSAISASSIRFGAPTLYERYAEAQGAL
jgi:hypothetical protein